MFRLFPRVRIKIYKKKEEKKKKKYLSIYLSIYFVNFKKIFDISSKRSERNRREKRKTRRVIWKYIVAKVFRR